MFGFLLRRKTDPKGNLKKVLGEFELPTFPNVVMETLEKIRDPASNADAIAKVLSTDPGLSVKVLKTVNSAAFSASRKIDDIKQAVALMGMSSLETLILSISAGSLLPKADSSACDEREFWRAAVLRATLGRSLADLMCPANRFECFTAGLLQDMALPFLAKQRPKEYRSLLEAWRRGSGNLAAMEREKFAWDHPEIATWLCNEWGLPERLAVLVGRHHGTNADLEGAVPAPVLLVSCIRDNPENDGVGQLVRLATLKCGISQERMQQVVRESRTAADELMELMVD